MKKIVLTALVCALLLSPASILSGCGNGGRAPAPTAPGEERASIPSGCGNGGDANSAADSEPPVSASPAGEPDAPAPSGDAEEPDAPAPSGNAEGSDTPAPSGNAEEPDAPASSGNAEGPDTPAPSDAAPTLADIRDKMVSDLGISDYMEMDASRLLDLYGIEAADISQSASFATMSGAFPGEIILVEAVDADAAGRIAGLLQNRLNEVLNQYKTYDAETYALAEACTVDTDGAIVSMLLSPERAAMRQILTDSLG